MTSCARFLRVVRFVGHDTTTGYDRNSACVGEWLLVLNVAR